MDVNTIISKLEDNAHVFSSLLAELSQEEYTWKIAPEKWSILEIVCHLKDEEVEDFRTRVRHVLAHPELPPPKNDPVGWVSEREYSDQNFQDKLASFLRERERSVIWLHSLEDPDWESFWQHPELGPQSAGHYLTNWLAHDYLHMRQIVRVKYDYLNVLSRESLSYAGNWK